MTLADSVASNQVDLQASLDWIDTLHGASAGLVHICAFGDWEGRSFHWATERDAAARYIQAKDNAQGVYLRVTTLRNPLEPGKRGSDTDSATFPGLWADIDLAGPGHKTTLKLPGDINDATDIIQAAQLPEPTVWIHSGGGLYPMWLLTKPHFINSDIDLEQLRVLSQTWQEAIAYGAEQLGFHYGTGVGDLSRVLRLPGTINRKEGLARPCRILEQTWGRGYTLDELRDHLVTAVRQIPEPTPIPQPTFSPRTSNGLSPGDDYENRTSWADILQPAGWSWHHRQGVADYWTRPGKNRRDGHSASTGRSGDRDRMFVFSTDTDLPAWQPITKFHAYTLLNHRGDHKSAARDLAAQGYGEQRPTVPKVDSMWGTADAGASWTPPGSAADFVTMASQVAGAAPRQYCQTSVGNAERLVDFAGADFRYVPDTKQWMAWNGRCWIVDNGTARVNAANTAMTYQIKAEADRILAADSDDKAGKSLYKWFMSSQMDSGMKGSLSQFSKRPEVVRQASDFDQDTGLLNLPNGVYDLSAHTLLAHDRKYLNTRMFGATYDPQATAARFAQMMETLIPDEQVRSFVQRSVGYSLLGKPNQRAVFILWGPKRTGKSQFLNIISALFGGYGATAMPGALHKKDNADGASPGLHALKGARFVSTSETSQNVTLDEESIKRLSGTDTMSTRALYQMSQTWKPQMTIWMAVNDRPMLSGDDGAIWDRVKPINFGTEFSADGSDNTLEETPEIWEEIWEAESSGILNWALDGLREFQRLGGLCQPKAIDDGVQDYQQEVDPVRQLWSDLVEQQTVTPDPDSRINFGNLYAFYDNVCTGNKVHSLGKTRFGRRLRAITGIHEFVKSNGQTWIPGWRWNPSHGMTGAG